MDPAYYLMAGLQLTDTLGAGETHKSSNEHVESSVEKTNLAAMNLIAGLVLCLGNSHSDESSMRGFATIGEQPPRSTSQALAATTVMWFIGRHD